jgi:hypothetical protein
MSCEHLICARCAGPVSEGRCPACQAAKAEVHHSPSGYGSRVLIATAILLILLIALAAAHGNL